MNKCQICTAKVRKTIVLPVRGVFADRGNPEGILVCGACRDKWACPGCGTSLYGFSDGGRMCPQCWFENREPMPARGRSVAFVALLTVFVFTAGCLVFCSN